MADKDSYLVADAFGNVYPIVGSDRLADYLSRGFTEAKVTPAKAPTKK